MNADGQILFEIRDLCKSFGDISVLKNISTTISQGEVVVIVGPSGSGKSTFSSLTEPAGGAYGRADSFRGKGYHRSQGQY